ncbi:TSUP family transporter [Thermohalobacter berrensis]|uniref:Probable membrane transporter protein n=1 Tax=Thermohalobacter berrensis TaxID=99594 RepID=A0A419TB50_9FIRM|nr:TSUP family transporter [Thermohalobacter berrensis]RKD34677.1 permease [Thermohalobacter berrensis]
MILFLVGFLSGIISGMGIGGGTILIPALIFFTSLSQHQAQGINLIVFIPIAIISLITHFINKNICIKLAIPIIISGLIGSILGSLLAVNLSSKALRKMFGLFLLFMGLYQIFSKIKNSST